MGNLRLMTMLGRELNKASTRFDDEAEYFKERRKAREEKEKEKEGSFLPSRWRRWLNGNG